MARPTNAEVDELFEVKTYYYIGAYQQCLNEINKLSRVNFLLFIFTSPVVVFVFFATLASQYDTKPFNS